LEKKQILKLLALCLVVAMVIGCEMQNKRLQMNDSDEHRNVPNLAIGHEEFSPNDYKYIEMSRELIRNTLDVISDLEEHLAEAQEHDESLEAEAIMEQTSEKIIFIWNQMHNGIAPEHPALTQFKRIYEGLLMNLRKGVLEELEGLRTGDPVAMKKGFTLTETSKDQLRELSYEIYKMMGWPTRIEEDSHIH